MKGQIGQSEISIIKHEELKKILDTRVSMLHYDKVNRTKQVWIVDVFCGDGNPNTFSNTSSPRIINGFNKPLWSKVKTWFNDRCPENLAQTKINTSGSAHKYTSCIDGEVYGMIREMLYANTKKQNADDLIYFIVFVDPNNTSSVDFDSLSRLMTYPPAKDLDLIINIPATYLKRSSSGVRYMDIIEKITSNDRHKAWIREPIKGDQKQWVITSLFCKNFPPSGPIKNYVDMLSERGSKAIEYYSTTNEEKKRQITIKFGDE